MVSVPYDYVSPMNGLGIAFQLVGWGALLQGLVIALYIFRALALYTMAQRRAIRKPWLAWIPLVDVWILGSLSDQYRYVVRGQIRSKRKILLALRIVRAVLVIALMVAAVVIVFTHSSSRALFGALLRAAAALIPIVGTWIASVVLKLMALYDIYVSCDPDNGTAYLVLSILFPFTRAIFLFLCRNKERGMPPRRTESVS